MCHDASEAENKKAHKELALLRRPNRNGDTLETTAKFQAVSTDAMMHTFNLEGAIRVTSMPTGFLRIEQDGET